MSQFKSPRTLEKLLKTETVRTNAGLYGHLIKYVPLRGQRTRPDSHPTQIPKKAFAVGMGFWSGEQSRATRKLPRDQLKAGAVLSGHGKRLKGHQYRNGSEGSQSCCLMHRVQAPK